MTDMRAMQREDMKLVRDDWWIPVRLTAPDKTVYSTASGTADQLFGDVRAESKQSDPELGNVIILDKLVVTLRIDDLERVPVEGENWFIEFNGDLTKSGPINVKKTVTANDVSEGGKTMGYIKLYPKDL